MTPSNNKFSPSRDERVAALAYVIWEQEGRPEGKSEKHWFMACEMIDAEDAQAEAVETPAWLSRAEPVQGAPGDASAAVEKMPQAKSKSAA